MELFSCQGPRMSRVLAQFLHIAGNVGGSFSLRSLQDLRGTSTLDDA